MTKFHTLQEAQDKLLEAWWEALRKVSADPLKDFLSLVWHSAYQAGVDEMLGKDDVIYDKGYKAAVEKCVEAAKSLKIITPTVEPPRNVLSQNQIFVTGQMNMYIRVLKNLYGCLKT